MFSSLSIFQAICAKCSSCLNMWTHFLIKWWFLFYQITQAISQFSLPTALEAADVPPGVQVALAGNHCSDVNLFEGLWYESIWYPQINDCCTLVRTNVKIQSRCSVSVTESYNGGSVGPLKTCCWCWKLACTVNLNQEVCTVNGGSVSHTVTTSASMKYLVPALKHELS